MSEGKFIEHNHESEHTREINMMQIKLAMTWDMDLPDDNEKFLKWAELYSKKFRDILDQELDEDIDFWEHFKDRRFHDDLLARIKERLYKDELEIAA